MKVILTGDVKPLGTRGSLVDVKDGYANGAASLNGKPLSGETPSTFLFRTFGAN